MLMYFLAGFASVSTLQPSGKWFVEFADSACVLTRRFGPETKPTYLSLKAPMLGQAYEIIIVVPNAKRNSGKTTEGGWIERPNGDKVAIVATSYNTVNGSRLTRFTIDPEEYIIGEDGERIILQLNKRRRYDLAMPGLKKAQVVLDHCLSGLRDDYGVGEAVTKQIATPAKPKRSVASYFSTNDYPHDAVTKGEQGYVGALFWVETDGRARNCEIIESSHRKLLDDRTCEVIQTRARFEPALDSQGKTIRSPLYQRIRWEMPQ